MKEITKKLDSSLNKNHDNILVKTKTLETKGEEIN